MNLLHRSVLVVIVAAVAAMALLSRVGPFRPETGLMPEVVVTAEMPRLVVDTVEVRAVRTVALEGSALRVN
jgi:hypothetical protein